MDVLWTICTLGHIIGLTLAIGCATVKVALLIRCRTDHAYIPVFLAVTKPVTKLLVTGLVMLTLSGIGWLVQGYPFTPIMILKLVLVAVIWVLGPVIDTVTEPKFRELSPVADHPVSPAFITAQKRHFGLEVIATGLFYVIVVLWIAGSQLM